MSTGFPNTYTSRPVNANVLAEVSLLDSIAAIDGLLLAETGVLASGASPAAVHINAGANMALDNKS